VPLSELDRRLLDRCLKHEAGAWRDFVDRYLGLIYHVVQHVAHSRAIVLRPEDVEDISGQILLGLVNEDYKILRQFRGACALPTYLTVIARRFCVKEVVRRQREAELGHVTASRAGVPEESFDEREPIATAEEVEKMLNSLPERDAEVIRLYHLESLNYRQIAKQLAIPENSVGPILARARGSLRRVAEQRNST
jgi:RNA polymerase sigma-70 factor (ECF subfamily)